MLRKLDIKISFGGKKTLHNSISRQHHFLTLIFVQCRVAQREKLIYPLAFKMKMTLWAYKDAFRELNSPSLLFFFASERAWNDIFYEDIKITRSVVLAVRTLLSLVKQQLRNFPSFYNLLSALAWVSQWKAFERKRERRKIQRERNALENEIESVKSNARV